MPIEEFHTVSSIKTRKVLLLWRMQDFSSCHQSKDKWFKSTIFGDKDKFQLHANFSGSSDQPKSILVRLHQLLGDIMDEEQVVEYRIGLRNRDGKDKFVYTGKTLPMHSDGVFIVEKKDILGEMKEELLPEDTLTMFCELAYESSLTNLSEEKVGHGESKQDIKSCEEELVTDLKSILQHEQYSDITLRSSDEMVFRGHRAVLHARSPVFADMIRQYVEKKSSGDMVLEDVDGDTLKEIVRYIYEGEVQLESQQKARLLYVAADKYKLQGLKQKCLEYIGENVTSDNVVDAILFALQSDADDLLETLEGVIRQNAKAIFLSRKWMEFVVENALMVVPFLQGVILNKKSQEESDDELAATIMQHFADVCKKLSKNKLVVPVHFYF